MLFIVASQCLEFAFMEESKEELVPFLISDTLSHLARLKIFNYIRMA